MNDFVGNINADYWNVIDIDHAKKVLFDYDCEGQYLMRWKQETAFAMDVLSRHATFTPETRVYEYGCGIGRMSQAILHQYNCYADGFEPNASTAALAPSYVQHDNFKVSTELSQLKYDVVLLCWSVCLSEDVQEAIKYAKQRLNPGGVVYISDRVNSVKRKHDGEWVVDDTQNIREAFAATFNIVQEDKLPRSFMLEEWSYHNSFWAIGRLK